MLLDRGERADSLSIEIKWISCTLVQIEYLRHRIGRLRPVLLYSIKQGATCCRHPAHMICSLIGHLVWREPGLPAEVVFDT